MEEFVTAKEAAIELKIPYQTFMTRVRRGRIAVKKVGWAVFIHRNELERVKANVRQANSQIMA